MEYTNHTYFDPAVSGIRSDSGMLSVLLGWKVTSPGITVLPGVTTRVAGAPEK